MGDNVLLPQRELERLLELTRQCGEIALQIREDDVPTLGIMHLVEQSGALAFWMKGSEDIYSADDGEPV
jgi:hypothetical protein